MAGYTFQLPKKFFGHHKVTIYATTTEEAISLLKTNTGQEGALIKTK